MALPEKTPPQGEASHKRTLGKGMFRRCHGCGETHLADVLSASLEVCPACHHHHTISFDRWEQVLLDPEPRPEEWDSDLETADPLEFSDGIAYPERIRRAKEKTGRREAARSCHARLGGIPVAFGGLDFAFMGGSMGSVVGETVTRLFERATRSRLPVVLLQASGGARMQEGVLSLMQMAKTVAALQRHRVAGNPYISFLLHPTTGGVAASFALLGDINLAEPGALIGFAGPRVIEATLREKLPEGFQRSEFLLKHGMIDRIVERANAKQTITTLLRHLLANR